MFYVGLDIHTKHISICVLNQDGKVHRRDQVRQVDQLVRVLEGLPDRFEVCFEASTGYGRFFELLSVRACRVVVAHPGLLRLIFRSKHKNDRRDAEKLAKLLYLGEVPAVHVPTADVRAWRELITFRQRLVQKRTRAKNGVRALLRCLGITAPPRPGIWTAKGLAWLKQLEFSQPLQALKRDLLVQEIEAFSQQLARSREDWPPTRGTTSRSGSCGAFRESAYGRPKPWSRSSTILIASLTARRLAHTSGWFRRRISPERRIDSGTSPERAVPRCGTCWSKRFGRRCAARRACEPITNASSETTRTARKSR